MAGLWHMAGLKFDPVINLGHLLTIVVLLAGGFTAYVSIETRIALVDSRTQDYAQTRDTVRMSSAKLELLETLVQSAAQDRRLLLATVTKVQIELSAMNAKLEEAKR